MSVLTSRDLQDCGRIGKAASGINKKADNERSLIGLESKAEMGLLNKSTVHLKRPKRSQAQKS